MEDQQRPPLTDQSERGRQRTLPVFETDLAALATFSPDATLIDDGATYVGTEQIRSWLAGAANEYTYTYTRTGIDDLGNGVHNHLSGDFPGGEVDLHHRFHLRDGLIHRLDIAP